MLFNSFEFIFLSLPVTYVLWALCRKLHADFGFAVLVIVSLFFYAWWNPIYLHLLLLSIAVNHVIGTHLGRQADRLWLSIGIGFNLALLGYFKYSNILVDSLNQVTGTGISIESILLPIGISFFAFQQIAWLVDSHRGLLVKTGLLRYSLFVSFFPQLIAGPIVHQREMLARFASPPAPTEKAKCC